jgi:hypothetical protein
VHEPLLQDCPFAHAFPQDPQLFGSIAVLVQMVPHGVWFEGHAPLSPADDESSPPSVPVPRAPSPESPAPRPESPVPMLPSPDVPPVPSAEASSVCMLESPLAPPSCSSDGVPPLPPHPALISIASAPAIFAQARSPPSLRTRIDVLLVICVICVPRRDAQ